MATNQRKGETAAGFHRGERGAFDDAAQEYLPALVNFITNLLHDRDRALELAQEAFLLACRSHQHVDPKRPLGPWLFQIARNVAYKDYNKRKKAAEVSLDEMMDQRDYAPLAKDDHPRKASARQEVWQRLEKAIARLKPLYRDVLILRMIQGLPSEKVSDLLGIPVATVNTNTHRALNLLRRYAKQEGLSINDL